MVDGWLMHRTSDPCFEVYVRAFPEGPGLWRVSTAGGRLPTWTADGRELLYVAPDGTLMRSALTSGPEFNASTPESLFRHDALHWAFSRDAQFGPGSTTCATAVESSSACQSPTLPRYPIIVVLNWEQLVDGQASAEHSRVPPAGQPAMVSGIRQAAVPEAAP